MNTEKVKTWFRKYWPWLAAGAGVIVLYLIYVNRQTGANTIPVSAGTQTGAPTPSSAQIAANTQLEQAALTAQERLAEAQISAETQRLKYTLDAQTAQAAQATTQAGQQATLAAIQAGQSGATTRSIIDTVGRSLPSILQAFRPPAGTVISSDTTFPTGAVEGATTGGQIGLPLAPLPIEDTQASTIILPTPTGDSSGPPLEAFNPFVGGVSSSPFENFL